ncbi:predicted protein [Botrytis cinerea T4]|uniref:Uncharacterized protein n=1 Tax=Botryotinia fuckeliana (strain T4) TaxID=999810 RepID=G2YH75_BOTF4|nr:predicted protein [Botrytis cinerea T4]
MTCLNLTFTEAPWLPKQSPAMTLLPIHPKTENPITRFTPLCLIHPVPVSGLSCFVGQGKAGH